MGIWVYSFFFAIKEDKKKTVVASKALAYFIPDYYIIYTFRISKNSTKPL